MRHLPDLEENFWFCPENPICEILCLLFSIFFKLLRQTQHCRVGKKLTHTFKFKFQKFQFKLLKMFIRGLPFETHSNKRGRRMGFNNLRVLDVFTLKVVHHRTQMLSRSKYFWSLLSNKSCCCTRTKRGMILLQIQISLVMFKW